MDLEGNPGKGHFNIQLGQPSTWLNSSEEEAYINASFAWKFLLIKFKILSNHCKTHG